MNWAEFEKSLREDSKKLQAELLKIPANKVAEGATIGTSAIVLGLLADAVARGRQS